MLSEAAHSAADTMNQVFLLVSLSFSKREPDVEHPFGYGKERFFWSFLAAVSIFVSGALFSVYEGVHRILGGAPEEGGVGIALAVPAIGLVLEGSPSRPSCSRTARRCSACCWRARGSVSPR